MLSPLDVLRLYPAHNYTLPGALGSRMQSVADRPFLTFAGRDWTWRSFADAVPRVAAALAARGIGKGDRVAIIDRNTDWHVVLLFALARLRAVMVPVNPDFGVEETAYVLGHAQVSGVFTGSEPLDTVRSAIGRIDENPWVGLTDGIEDGISEISALLNADSLESVGEPEPDDTCIIIYTSGTTGFPKGVMHSHRNYLLAGEAFVQRVHLQPDDRVMIVLPLYHMNALFYSTAGTVAAGSSMVVVPKFSASTFWHTAANSGATEVNIIEAIGTILATRSRSEYRPDHRLRAVYGVRENVAAIFRNEFGIHDLLGGFGMTEIPGVTCNPFGKPRKPGSMGPIGEHPDPARKWAECRVVDESGRDLQPGEIGELWVRTPIVMQGYFRDPGQTWESFSEDWFKTGDLVRTDEDGWFYFVSRKKDIIRRRGENIAAAELDRVVAEHPDVHEAAAIAVPSELGEDDILVAVAPREGAQLTAEEIADWCRSRLAAIKVPRFVIFVDVLPHTPTHKVAKAVLRNDETLRSRAIDLQSRAPLTNVHTEGV